MGTGRPAPPRRDQHLYRLAHVLIVGYLLAAAAVASVDPDWLAPRWLALHLLFLGAATTAIALWSSHFAQALTRSADGDRWLGARLIILSAGILAVLAGLATESASGIEKAAVVIGAVLVVGAVALHVVVLGRMATTRFGGPLRSVTWFYVAAGVAFLVGASVGAGLGVGRPDVGASDAAVEAVHVHLNLLGWIGLTVLGTLFMLWPAALRVRMDPALPRVLRPVLTLTSTGLAVSVVGLLTEVRLLAGLGLVAYLGGVTVLAWPMLATARRGGERRGPALALAMATGWLAAFVALDAVAVIRDGTEGTHDLLHDVAPIVAAGFVGQVLVGAMTFLLPVVLGGGPAGHKRLASTLLRWWEARVLATNAGLVIVIVAGDGRPAAAGWLMALGGLGSFLPLAAVALTPPARTGVRRAR